MKTNKYLLLLISTLFLTISCSDYTDGINQSPNEFTEAPGDLLIGQANLAAVKISESQSARLANLFTDQFTGTDRQYITFNNYTLTAEDFNDDWVDVYVNGVAQARLAKESAIENGDLVLEGVSSIIESLLIGETAALWGDIPYSEAFDAINHPNPTYDAQADVLDAIQILLSDAITKVGSTPVADAYGSPVYVSNENFANWGEVAHSLKARYYLIAKNYPMALSEAKLGISSKDNDLLAAHGTDTGTKNLYFRFGAEEREDYLTAGDSHLRKLMDGRTSRLLTTPGDTIRAAKYFNGVNLNYTTGGYFAQEASFPIVSFYETKLIEAEAEQRINPTSSMGRDALNSVRTALALEYAGDFPASTSSGTVLLNEILEEKYITLIGSLQVYHDVRRTNNAIGVPVKNTSQGNTTIPQRFLYPQIELNSNTNFPGIINQFTKTPVNN